MDWTPVRLGVCMNLLVVLFQVFGVLALCLSRLHVAPHWVGRGRVAFAVALVGLGLAGALCGRHDQQFGLFAGLSITTLLIGMTVGGGHEPEDPALLVADGAAG